MSYTKTSNYRVGSGVTGAITRSHRKIGGSSNLLSASGLLLDSTRVNGRLYVDSLDLAARTATSRSPQGRQSRTLFDLRGNPLSVQAWAPLARTFSYDSAGQVVSSMQGGRVDSVQWNALGHPSRERRADGAVVTYGHDSLGRVLTLGLPGALFETFAYDASGNPTRANLLGGRSYGFAYNAHDKLIADSLVSAGLELGRYAYNGADQLTAVTRPGRPALTFMYDAAGRLTSAGSAATWMRVSYDPGNDLPATIGGSSGQTYSILYDGRLPTFINASGLVGGGIEYLYTSESRTRMVRITGRASTDYQFDADGLVTRGGQLGVTRDPMTGAITGDTIGVVATTRLHDAHGDLRRLELRVAGRTQLSQALVRDSLGRLTASADSSASATSTIGYRYDALDRLDQVSRDGVVSQQLSYDLAGNRLASTTNGATVAATYATDDRIQSFDGREITHDAAGARLTELTATDSLAYSHDDVGRLTSIASRLTGVLSFNLDAFGRRVQELRNGTVVRQFLYGASPSPIGEFDAGGLLRSEFVYVTGGLAPDYVIQGSRTIYLLRDQLGSVRMAIDVATGAVLQEIEYDASGRVTRNTNASLQPFAYAGGMVDSDGRSVHFGARDYDARTGRWLQPDPTGALGGANRYVYAENSPTNFVDPDGLAPQTPMRSIVPLPPRTATPSDPCATYVSSPTMAYICRKVNGTKSTRENACTGYCLARISHNSH